jgi:hypothetical protein
MLGPNNNARLFGPFDVIDAGARQADPDRTLYRRVEARPDRTNPLFDFTSWINVLAWANVSRQDFRSPPVQEKGKNSPKGSERRKQQGGEKSLESNRQRRQIAESSERSRMHRKNRKS